MKKINTDELKEIQLNILLDIDNFCKINSIRYSLAFGTLLGAIRHHGYIPWDDDIDIMLPREDYERFISEYNAENFKVISTKTNKKYFLPFAKVYDKRTSMKEESSYATDFGVYVDIFPIDYAPDTKKGLQSFMCRKKIVDYIHSLKIIKVNKNRDFYKNFIIAIAHVFFSPISIQTLTNRIEKISSELKSSKTSKMGVIAPTDNKSKWIVNKTIFDDYCEVSFEGFSFMAITKYDDYLTATYGNYMQLPPENQRQAHHAFTAEWL